MYHSLNCMVGSLSRRPNFTLHGQLSDLYNWFEGMTLWLTPTYLSRGIAFLIIVLVLLVRVVRKASA